MICDACGIVRGGCCIGGTQDCGGICCVGGIPAVAGGCCCGTGVGAPADNGTPGAELLGSIFYYRVSLGVFVCVCV